MSSNQTLDVEALDDASVLGLVEGIVALRKQAAQVHAAEVRLLATAGELAASRSAALRSDSREREMHLRSIAAELALAVRASDRTVQRQINDAVVLAEDFTPVLEALEEGRIFVGHARVILDAGTPIQDPEARLVFAADAVARAENLSPARLRPAVEALAERLQPRTVTERHRDARADRAVTVTDRPDGMGELIYIGPATLVHGIYDRLTQQARAVRNAAQPGASFGPAAVDPSAGRGTGAATTDGAGVDTSDRTPELAPDSRTIDQLRADVFADMLLTSAPQDDPTLDSAADPSLGFGGLGAIRAIVHVTVPALALAGLSDEPAELVGRAPIDIDTARRLAGRATGWDRVLSDPVHGGILAVDRYTPNADLKRFLRARDEHCRFPGCRQPAHRCDIDHGHDWAHGGTTCAHNLHHLCRRHHTLKHATPWQVRNLGGGVLEWTSPTGAIYIDDPPSRVRFAPTGPPPPF
ncbi:MULTISPECIES: HNH endonuclease signature motif containing protein [unclassified Microbacterium]|uniref:HNH endonuclease signature motif containing protein n=1 Tax=unclassified Microbacterium TaxID=2609290 RepID=UPI0012FD3FDE|nr:MULTISPECIES: HNH endonuclease signature motif containing protein [unclassified Microbacterium]